MNDKCCTNCGENNCPVLRVQSSRWKGDSAYCSFHVPLPNKPGKIEPLSMLVSEGKMVEAVTTIGIKVNELIAAHNGRDGK